MKFEDENNSVITGMNPSMVNHNQNLDWGNTIGSLRWNHLISDRLFANTTLTFSKFWFKTRELYLEESGTDIQDSLGNEDNSLFYNFFQHFLIALFESIYYSTKMITKTND